MPKIGTIALYAGRTEHLNRLHAEEWHLCDGTLMNFDANTLLSIVIGQKYGGYTSDFALPTLDHKYLDKKLHTFFTTEVYLPYIISIKGEYNSELTYAVDFSEEQLVGMVVPFEGDNIPDGWEKCNGKVMKATDNKILSTLINSRFYLKNDEMMLPNTGAEKYIICTRGRV